MDTQYLSGQRTRDLVVVFGLAFVFSWAIGIPLALSNQGVIPPILPAWAHYFLAYGPMLSALFVTWFSEGPPGLKEIGARMVKWNVRPIWWVVALSPLVLGFAVVPILNVVTGSEVRLSTFGEVRFLPPLGVAALLLWILTFGIGEETGWRGYALPRLQYDRSALLATIILWFFWALWHLPAFFYLYDPAIVIGWLEGNKNARLVIRVLIILLADAGKTLAETAKILGCCEQTVLNWRKRFLECRSEGPVAALMDLPRSGRPVTYGAQERVQVIAIVCETLHEHELPLSRFSIADLHRVVVQEESLADLSPSSLGRILQQDALKPWRYHYWLFPRDPNFVTKACVILDLYAGFWEGQPLGPDEFLLSADEKTIQVLVRCHPGLPAIPGYEQRVEFEYERLGTVAYHAAWDVFRGQIFGRVAPNTCIATFNQLVDMIMTQAPYQSSARTLWIVDGGCAHHPHTFPARLQGMYPNAVAVSLPVHSSWLNQIEIYFSIVQRKVLTPLDVPDKVILTNRVLDFQDYYQERAQPFSWKFTAANLKKVSSQ